MKLREFAHEIDDAIAQKGLASGKPNFFHTHSHKHARHPQVIGEWEIAVERALIAGAAVNTLVVTAVGNGDPQVRDGPSEFVAKGKHWHSAISNQQDLGGTAMILNGTIFLRALRADLRVLRVEKLLIAA